MQSTFRKNLLWLHTWVGLTVGLAMVFLAVTGGVLVMRPQFEGMVDHQLLSAPACSAPLPLDAIAASAKAAHPADKLASIEVTLDHPTSVAVQFSNKDYVYVDPCSGRPLGVQNQYGGFFGTVDYLHRFRWIGNGRRIGGWLSAVCLVLLVIGGVVLWWPKSRSAIRSAFTFNARLPGLAKTLNLHKVVGAWAAALLLAMTITALPLSFDWARELISLATSSPVDSRDAPKAPPHVKGKPMNMQALWDRARTDVPTMQWAAISYPKKKTGVVEVEILERGMPHKNAKSYLYLDAVSGEALKINHYATDTTLGRKVYLYFLALHSGLIFGIPYQLALMLACFSVPVQAYSGFSPYIRKQLRKAGRNGLMPLKVVAKTVEANAIVSFELAHPRGKVLPAFSAGSHIDLQVGPGLTRQYSLCNDPKETHRYLVAVLREEQSRGASVRMHDEVQVGDVLAASTPRNHFPLAHGAQRSLLIAGGIGITPILCMAERLANIEAEFALHYCVRSLAAAAFVERIRGSAFAERVSFHPRDEGRRLNVPELLAAQPPETHVYVCGPNRLIDEVVASAPRLGWAEERIHREYFAAATHDTANDQPFELKIASTGLTIEVPKECSVVDALAAHGIDIPTSCAEGVCGTCLTRVLEGEVVHRDMLLTPEERARNDQFTPCCSRACGPLLVLDL
jgi:vanillate O-demethylase ferredoxin subunit